MKLVFELDADKINSIQLESMRKAIDKSKHVSWTDLAFRVNGNFQYAQADWLKHLREVGVKA